MSEQISALVDEELELDELQRVLTALQGNKQVAETWGAYHLIGDAMRGNPDMRSGFRQQVMQKIEQEPTVLAPNVNQVAQQRTAAIKNKLPMAWSVAASCAAVMVVAWVAFNQQSQDVDVLAETTIASVQTGQTIPAEYMLAHQASAPSTSSYYIQSVSYSE